MQQPSIAPIYRSGRQSFSVDSCVAQIQAVAAGKIQMQALTKGHYPGKRMETNILPGLQSIGFWNCREPQDWGLDFHRNEGVEIVFLETGGMGFQVDGRTYELGAGALTITRPWQLHKLGDPHIGRGRLYWLILDVGVRRPNQDWAWPEWLVLAPGTLAELARKLRHSENPVWQTNARIKDIFREMAVCVDGWGQPHMESRLTLGVNRLLLELLEVVTEDAVDETAGLATRRRTVELFLKDLAAHPASCAEPWCLETMAEHCGVGATSLVKYSRELVNNGPVQYLNLCRLEHAARSLRDGPEPVTAIAFRCGFNSSQYFATQFRKRFGTTPMAYRQGGD